MNDITKKYKKKALLTRFGGIGDVIPVLLAAKQLRNKAKFL